MTLQHDTMMSSPAELSISAVNGYDTWTMETHSTEKTVSKGVILLLILLAVGIAEGGWFLLQTVVLPNKVIAAPQAAASPTPTGPVFPPYTQPELAKKDMYQIVLVGDSMTHALGPRGGTFSEFINELYKPQGIGIVIDNYAVGSTNVLSLKDAMNKETTYWDSTFPPLLSRDFDLILIESFGYNPLSEYPLEEGLKKQEAALDEAMKSIINSHPKSRVAFVVTIAPDKDTYALKINPNTTLQDRTLQVEERVAYMKNHLQYAQKHSIPVINIYEKSLIDGDGNPAYINPDDNIHPSFAGVDFIGHTLANSLYETQLLPH